MTENGWPPDTDRFPGKHIDESKLVLRTIPGTKLQLRFQEGIPSIILPAFMADLNEFIEPVMNSRGLSDEGSFTYTNSVGTSNHLGGTAFDYNWSDHPFLIKDSGWNGSILIDGDQVPAVRALLKYYNYKGLQIVFWGNDWDSPKDSMHFQMGYGTYKNQAIVNEFIEKYIRPDGFSRYLRGDGSPRPQVATGLTAITLSEAMGGTLSLDRYAQLLPYVVNALILSGCNTLNRIAMWMAQIGHESSGLYYMEEIASGDAYDTRTDLGNTPEVDGDGRKYKGRGPIQVTGKTNYAQLSMWAYRQGLVPSSSFFVDYPEKLAELQYAFLGAIWYWTVARPDINSLCDEGDLETVTRRINGGLTNIEDRRKRWNKCLAMGMEKLAVDVKSIFTPEFLEALMSDQELYRNQSIFRNDNNKWMSPMQTMLAIDAMLYEGNLIVPSALRGEQWAIALVVRLARGEGPGAKVFEENVPEDQWKTDTWAIEHAQSILKDIEAKNPAALKAFLQTENKV